MTSPKTRLAGRHRAVPERQIQIFDRVGCSGRRCWNERNRDALDRIAHFLNVRVEAQIPLDCPYAHPSAQTHPVRSSRRRTQAASKEPCIWPGSARWKRGSGDCASRGLRPAWSGLSASGLGFGARGGPGCPAASGPAPAGGALRRDRGRQSFPGERGHDSNASAPRSSRSPHWAACRLAERERAAASRGSARRAASQNAPPHRPCGC